jgi:hypothetical protein
MAGVEDYDLVAHSDSIIAYAVNAIAVMIKTVPWSVITERALALRKQAGLR